MVTPLLLQYLQLAVPGGYTQAALARAIKHCGCLAGLEAADEHLFAEVGIDPFGRQEILARLQVSRNHSTDRARQISRWLADGPRHLLCFEDRRYPPLLRELDCPPPLLYVEGNPELLNVRQLAMVGSRKASESGRRTAHWLASELARVGIAITSGLAVGIDAHAHHGALAAEGVSLAVVGTGLDRVYPPGHRSLASRIVEQGALISEFPLGTPPRPGNFPQRNRIIAGLSSGVIVVEAAPKSGSLITARLAMEANREVFAVPGSIHNGNARGCHDLIRQGAKLVDGVESILEELAMGEPCPAHDRDKAATPSARLRQRRSDCDTTSRPALHDVTKRDPPGLCAEEKQLLKAMEYEPCSADELVLRSGMSIEQVSRLLLALELKGLLTQAGGRFERLAAGAPY